MLKLVEGDGSKSDMRVGYDASSVTDVTGHKLRLPASQFRLHRMGAFLRLYAPCSTDWPILCPVCAHCPLWLIFVQK